MYRRVCLNPDIKWDDAPKIIRTDTVRVSVTTDDNNRLVMTVKAKAKRMSRKRLVKLLMAHGMLPRSARKVAGVHTREGWPHIATYEFVIEKMHEFIAQQNKQGGEKDEPVQQSVPPMEAAQDQ